jgi:hypothetical protein
MYSSEVHFLVQEILYTYDLNGSWTTIAKKVVAIWNRIFRKYCVIYFIQTNSCTLFKTTFTFTFKTLNC